MEQHPVPRNISSFQFHLIGDMTLRQFGYLVAGGISAFIIFKISPFPTLIKYGVAGVFALGGVAFAFLPIQERPLDKWLAAFIKSIFSPTQYVWQKEGILLDILTRPVPSLAPVSSMRPAHVQAHQDAENKLRQYLATLPQTPHQTLNQQEKIYIDKTLAMFGSTGTLLSKPTVVTAQQPVQRPAPVVQEKPKPVAPAPPPPPATPTPTPTPAFDISEIQKQLAELVGQKESLMQELINLKTELKKIEEPLIVKPEVAREEKKPTIKAVTPEQAVDEIGMPALPQFPNIVIGVVKDAQKRLLPNIIITIKDEKGVPLRALKTNKLGQFATATPLPNGTYLLEVEDPLKRYTFDIAQITLSGKVFLPIAISAKGEKEMLRAKLTKELFGTPT